MYPYVQLFGINVSTYGICAAIAIVVAIILTVLYVKKSGASPEDRTDYLLSFLFGSIGALLGSKILYLITVWPQFLSDFNEWGRKDPAAFVNMYTSGGFVYLGGFFGAVIAILLFCKLSKFDVGKPIYAILPALPAAHAIGRIGCFMAGCCYGAETDSAICVVFHDSFIAPNGVPLIPVQLYESAGEVLLFLLMLWLRKKQINPYRLLGTYMFLYGILRFILEFFRGDSNRGFVGFFSTSQILGFIMIGVGAILLFKSYSTRASSR